MTAEHDAPEFVEWARANPTAPVGRRLAFDAIAEDVCTCYDPAAMEYGPDYPCARCIRRRNPNHRKES